MAAVVVVLALVGAACKQLHVDNRAVNVVGATNGQLGAHRLSTVNGCTVYWEAAQSLREMLAAAARDGVTITPSSCYRDYAGQVAARENWCRQGACHMAAAPGTSNHGWGKAVDFREGSSSMTYTSRGYLWMLDHAGDYGWLHPKVMKADGPVPEPWHWEWVGDGGRMFPGEYFGIGNSLPMKGSPVGSVDAVTSSPGTVRLQGWALDPDGQEPTDVHVYANGAVVGGWRAESPRPDVAAAFPAYSSRHHGFDLTFAAAPGRQQVCVYGIEIVGTGGNSLIGCRDVVVTPSHGLPMWGSPIGAFDAATGLPGAIRIEGWAMDPDGQEPTDVHVYVNGAGVGGWRAESPRPDVAAAFPAYAARQHGYDVTFGAAPGRHQVCVYAIEIAGTGSNSLIGCKEVVVPASARPAAAPAAAPMSTPTATTMAPTTTPTTTTTVASATTSTTWD